MLMEEGKLSLDDPIANTFQNLAWTQNCGWQDAANHAAALAHSHLRDGRSNRRRGESRAHAVRPGTVVCLKAACIRAGEANGNTVSPAFSLLGRIVEIVSGVPFEVFLRTRIFDPLGMKDTTFYLTEAQMPRWVIPAKREGEQLLPAEIGLLYGHPPTWRDHYRQATVLFSTAPDYTRFAQMSAEWRRVRWQALSHGRVGAHDVNRPDWRSGHRFTPGNGWGWEYASSANLRV